MYHTLGDTLGATLKAILPVQYVLWVLLGVQYKGALLRQLTGYVPILRLLLGLPLDLHVGLKYSQSYSQSYSRATLGVADTLRSTLRRNIFLRLPLELLLRPQPPRSYS